MDTGQLKINNVHYKLSGTDHKGSRGLYLRTMAFILSARRNFIRLLSRREEGYMIRLMFLKGPLAGL